MCRSAPAALPLAMGPPPAHNNYTEIRNVTGGQVAFKTCTVQLAEVTLPLLMDTGAAASLLNSSTYYRFFSHLPLEQPATALCGYDSSRLDIMGVLRVPVHYGSKHLPSFPFHIARKGANLLGLGLFTGLGFTLRDNAGSAIHHVDSTWRQKWPALFDGLGCLTAFTHRPLVNPDVSPIIQPLRRIPLALRDDVTHELGSLLEMGIIEQVNAAPWISNLVIAKKKSGGIRICVDLRLVNKAVIPDRYPLPTSEEFTALFYGSSVTDHQALTALLTASGSGHKPLRLHRWGERLRQYDYEPKFTPGRDNVVADLLSRSIDAPTPIVSPGDNTEPKLIQMLHTPLQPAVSLEELQQESECDPMLTTLRMYIRSGWPAKVPDELTPFSRVRDELSCWGDVCVSSGLCTVVPMGLRGRVLSMAHEGHLGIVKLKQRCRDLVWWPGIDRDIEALVRDCAPCLLSGKTGPPVPTPLQPVPWLSRPWEHLQLDICGEIHGRGIPHHRTIPSMKAENLYYNHM
ncbi:hypothetical protein SKAU_G00219890 [Synaphobranchus kaupii]|uniref:Gypsy retrotransposon integrase-like protein 1 n=1 Tax=Synaphobranchus kaupii TaxID=118154 RepID=A0A9Q1IUW2_SYNKA|nr:hypothetical protein SKAU_G00219890 [Synaphobranchus kaupii]